MNGTAKTREKSIIEQQKGEIQLLKEQNRMLSEELYRMRSSLEWFKRQFFGAKSEKSIRVLENDPQISLFEEEAEGKAALVPHQDQEEQVVKSHKRQKRTKPTIEELKKVLEVEEVVIPLGEEQKNCPKCGSAMQPVGREFVRSELVREQPRVYIKDIYRETYVCKNESHEEQVFAKAPVAPSVIAHSLASASTVAYVMDQKYRFAKTLYRMEQEWRDLGVDISRQTMSNWVVLAANDWLQPILERMKPVLLAREIVHADETTFPLLPEKGSDKHRTKICYAWVYTTGSYEREVRMAIYEYQPGRSGEYARSFLAGYHGALQTDGYAGYDKLPVRLHALCMAHARRKFVYALPEEERMHPERSKKTAGEAVRWMDKLFRIDEKFKDLSPEERVQGRLQHEKPVLEALKSWLEEKRHVLPGKTKLDEAINYTLNHWDGLTAYLQDGNCSLTNNICERAVRPFTTGRKNWLFSGSEDGARASAAAYSMSETCKLNGVSFYKYLCLVFSEVPGLDFHCKPELLDRYLPWNGYVKDKCK